MAFFSSPNERLAREIIDRYPRPRSALIPLLHLAQEQEGWVTDDAMREIAELTDTTPAEVKGTGSFSKGLWNTITDFKIEYEFADGVQQTYEIGRAFVRVEGAEGWLEAQVGKALTASSEELLHSQLEPGEVSFSGTLEDKVDFLRAIKEDRETLEPVEVGHRTVSLCQLGLIAVRLGRPLKWDPDAERFLDDNAANTLLSRPIRDPWGI